MTFCLKENMFTIMLTFQSMVEKKLCRLISSAPSEPDPANKTFSVVLLLCAAASACCLILTQPVGRVPLEQGPEQRLGLRTQELRHS